MLAFIDGEVSMNEFRKGVAAHIKHDMLKQGSMGNMILKRSLVVNKKARGCSIFCLTGRYNHESLEILYGIDRLLGELVDGIFEGVAQNQAKQFHADVWLSLGAGVNARDVVIDFLAEMLIHGHCGVVSRCRYGELKRWHDIIKRQDASDIGGELVYNAASHVDYETNAVHHATYCNPFSASKNAALAAKTRNPSDPMAEIKAYAGQARLLVEIIKRHTAKAGKTPKPC